MTLRELLKFNSEVNAFDYLFIVDETDKRLKTYSIVTREMCISRDLEDLEILSTHRVYDTHKVDGICYFGICKPSQRGGLVVEVLNKKQK